MCEHLDFIQYPIDESVRTLGRKWAGPVLMEILSGRDRFNTLRKINRINTRTLATRLRDFERSGIIQRKVRTSNPERVHYVLTEKGQAMRRLLGEIAAFSLKWHTGGAPTRKRPPTHNALRPSGFENVSVATDNTKVW